MVKAVFLEKTHRIKPTEAQQKGLYFEYQCIGATAREFEVVDDLPRLRNGNKSVDQQRIDTQVIMFQRMLDKYGMKLLTVQEEVSKVWMHPYSEEFNEEVILFGTIDFKSPVSMRALTQNNEIRSLKFDEAIFDLKLTANIMAVFKDGSSWKNPWTMNTTQARMYKYITGLPFFYLVFDYKPKPERRIYFVEDDPQKTLEMHEAIRKTAEELVRMKENDYQPLPIQSVCNTCPIEDCPLREQAIECQIF